MSATASVVGAVAPVTRRVRAYFAPVDRAAGVLFATAFGVLIDGVLMEVVSATESEVFGVPYVYRLVLRAPLGLVV